MWMNRVVGVLLILVSVASVISIFGVTYQYSTTTTSTFTTTSKETDFKGNWGWVVILLFALFIVTLTSAEIVLFKARRRKTSHGLPAK
jgi:amino acid permease